MGPIIRTCKLALAAALAATPAVLAAKTDDAVDRYAERKAGGNRATATARRSPPISSYIARRPTAPFWPTGFSPVPFRSGDMPSAVRAVRTQELRGEVSNEAPLLLFADAFRQKKWAMASLAADELATRSNFGFMAPVLKAWVDGAQGQSYEAARVAKGRR